MEIKTLQFPNNSSGQAKKNAALQDYFADGWKLVSETITPGHYNADNACCMFLLCGPVGAFMGGRTTGTINVTLQRDNANVPQNRDVVQSAHVSISARDRKRKAVRNFLIFLGLAVMAVFLPGLHFILVPAFLFLSVFAALSAYIEIRTLFWGGMVLGVLIYMIWALTASGPSGATSTGSARATPKSQQVVRHKRAARKDPMHTFRWAFNPMFGCNKQDKTPYQLIEKEQNCRARTIRKNPTLIFVRCLIETNGMVRGHVDYLFTRSRDICIRAQQIATADGE